MDADYFTTVQGEGNSFNPAMWGKIVNGAVQMKHLGGVFCIKVPKMPIKAGILSLIVDKKITGNFTVDLMVKFLSLNQQKQVPMKIIQ